MKRLYKICFAMLSAAMVLSCSSAVEDETFTPITPEISIAGDKAIQVENLGGEFTIDLESNLPWRVRSTESWVTFEGAPNGLGSAELTIAVGINKTYEPRSASVIAWITDDCQYTIDINQNASIPGQDTFEYFVKANATGDGSSWSEPMDLSEAIANAMVGDVIHVAAGTYTPSKGLGGSIEARDCTFELSSNITVIGGYPSDATEGAVSDPEANVTTLSAAGAYHVVSVTSARNPGECVTLQGFTIKGAAADGAGTLSVNSVDFPRNAGGGVIIGNSEVKFIDCKISNNSAAMAAGVHVFGKSTATFEHCEISQNSVVGNGAGICNWNSTVIVNNSLIANNSATGVAGGIYSYLTSRTELYNTTISGNSVGSPTNVGLLRGAGYYIREGSTAVMVNCTFSNNSADFAGAIAIYGKAELRAKADIINCTITNNEARSHDGGIYIYPNTDMNICNSIVSGNKSASGNKDISNTSSIKLLSSIDGGSVYNEAGAIDGSLTFDSATMIESLADNGGYFQTHKLTGSNNPAISNGMSYSALQTLGSNYSPVIPVDIIGKDQTGASRDGKNVMGACVK